MTDKELFVQDAYQKLERAIYYIDDSVKKDIYALTFWFYLSNDDFRYPAISVSYNTNEHFKSQIKNASGEEEAKWNFALWLQDEILKIGGEDDELLYRWFRSSQCYFSEKERIESENDDELFKKILTKGNYFSQLFVQEIIGLSQELFQRKIIKEKFGENIPIIIQKLEYYEEPISWTKMGNPEGLADGFLEWVKSR